VKGGGFVEFGVTYTKDNVPTTFEFRKIHKLINSKQINSADTFFPSITKVDEVKTLNDVEDLMTEIVAGNTIMKQSKLKELTLEMEKTKIYEIPADHSVKLHNPSANY